MVLDAAQRSDANRLLIKKMFVELNQTAQLDSAEAQLLIDSLDDYIEANATAINNAVPVAVRTKATMPQKALALAYVAMKRGGVI